MCTDISCFGVLSGMAVKNLPDKPTLGIIQGVQVFSMLVIKLLRVHVFDLQLRLVRPPAAKPRPTAKF